MHVSMEKLYKVMFSETCTYENIFIFEVWIYSIYFLNSANAYTVKIKQKRNTQSTFKLFKTVYTLEETVPYRDSGSLQRPVQMLVGR